MHPTESSRSTLAPLTLSARTLVAPRDVGDVLALLHERSAWLSAKGIDQWQPPYPADRLARDIDAGTVWCWRVADKLTAIVTLSSARPDYHPAHVWLEDVPSWYLCRLAVALPAAGHSTGTLVLASIEADARHDGVCALRLDVQASNTFLTQYYARFGYREVSRGTLLGRPTIFLEKALRAG